MTIPFPTYSLNGNQILTKPKSTTFTRFWLFPCQGISQRLPPIYVQINFTRTVRRNKSVVINRTGVLAHFHIHQTNNDVLRQLTADLKGFKNPLQRWPFDVIEQLSRYVHNHGFISLRELDLIISAHSKLLKMFFIGSKMCFIDWRYWRSVIRISRHQIFHKTSWLMSDLENIFDLIFYYYSYLVWFKQWKFRKYLKLLLTSFLYPFTYLT